MASYGQGVSMIGPHYLRQLHQFEQYTHPPPHTQQAVPAHTPPLHTQQAAPAHIMRAQRCGTRVLGLVHPLGPCHRWWACAPLRRSSVHFDHFQGMQHSNSLIMRGKFVSNVQWATYIYLLSWPPSVCMGRNNFWNRNNFQNIFSLYKMYGGSKPNK